RCMIEARPRSGDPLAVTAEAADLDTAARDASSKMLSRLDSHFGKADRRPALASPARKATARDPDTPRSRRPFPRAEPTRDARMMRPAVLVLAGAVACVSCAPIEEQAEPIAGLSTDRQCFFSRQINGYGDAPDGPRGDRIYISTGVRERFLLETFGSCPELD